MLSFCFTKGVGRLLVNCCEVVEHTWAKRPMGLGLRSVLAHGDPQGDSVGGLPSFRSSLIICTGGMVANTCFMLFGSFS